MNKFERRLYIGFAILVALVTPLLIGAFFVISEIQLTESRLISENVEDVIESERLNSLLNQEFSLVQAYILRGTPQIIQALETTHLDFQKTSSALILKMGDGESPAILEEVRQLERDAFKLAESAIQMKKDGRSIRDLDTFFETANQQRGDRMRELVRANSVLQDKELQEAKAHADHFSEQLVGGLIVACAFSLLATVAVVILMFQTIRTKSREDKARELKHRLEAELSTARKEAVEIVAHDLKNPLSSLKMSVELLKDELTEANVMSPEVDMGFQIANRSIVSMQRLIEDQLDHTKIESGQLALNLALVNVADMISDLEMRFRPLAEAKDLTMSVQIQQIQQSQQSLGATIDRTRFDQVISNLLGNALKFTRAGGSITLSAERVGSFISVKVRDTGDGISAEALEHIFERYWQVKETSQKGTGLGLAIAKGIVEAHGGTLRCDSALGLGTTFEVIIGATEIR